MTAPSSRAELLTAFAGAADEIGGYFAGLDDKTFWTGTAEQWGAAHHLDHLIRSNRPVAGGLGAARDRLQPLPPEHPRRSSAEIEAEYRAALSSGARAFGRWLPQPEGTQAELVERYRASLAGVRAELESWTDAELDAWAMPHPVLGVLSVREMMLFTLLHNLHHLAGVRSRSSEVAPGPDSGDNGAS